MFRSLKLLAFILTFGSFPLQANQPDSALLFAYATTVNAGKNGLHFAWSIDGENWHPIGPQHSFVKSDYGTWGGEKRMVTPFLIRGDDDLWHCIWSLNETDGAFAHAASSDLVHWKRQSYPVMSQEGNCLLPVVFSNHIGYTVTWLSSRNGSTHTYATTTTDFKKYTPAVQVPVSGRDNHRALVTISGNPETGTINTVSWTVIGRLTEAYQLSAYKKQKMGETTREDPVRFASLQPVDARLKVDVSKSKKISDMLMGVFFEDINYAADGGLYAELVQNRGFEYSPADKKGRDRSWNSYKAWTLKGEHAAFTIDSVNPVHPNNRHYAVLDIGRPGAALVNEGFDGIPVKAGSKYLFSVFAAMTEGKGGKLLVRLTGPDGTVIGEATTRAVSSGWKKYEVAITAKQTVPDARLEVVPQMAGRVALDLVSLFPQHTFKNRRNGLRADLAQAIADLHPRFVRFPGGCVAHGDGLGNIYHWKNTIGPLEARVPQRNLWGYHQSAGLGYFEYFQFCEDIGAEPVPIVAAGVPCQNSSTGGGGQQGGIPMGEMDHYIQDILDLVEYANGDARSGWGKKRAEAGHPQPFNLKYIGVGNEDLITDIFEERFAMIYWVLKERHPEITVIGTAGPFHEGTDYDEGWELATRLGVSMIDEHYYEQPGWFIYNQDFYDRYDRSKARVYLGEYAAHLPGRPNNVETALAEALYLSSLERNGDIVSMSSYAPLLAKEGHTQWNPDLIYFNNTEVKPTVGYYVQQLYGQYPGDEYLPASLSLSENKEEVKARIAASVVRDNRSGNLVVKLINLLPVPVNISVDLSGCGNIPSGAVKTVLQGRPDDRNARPVQSAFQAGQAFDYSMPQYSITVIQLKTEN